MAPVILALVTVHRVKLAELATALSSRAKPASNYPRLPPFVGAFELAQARSARAVVNLLPLPARWVLTLERTNWPRGRVEINLRVLGVGYEGLAVPLFWTVLGTAGPSTTAARRALGEQFGAHFGLERAALRLGDREFIGAEWLDYRRRARRPLRLRLKANPRVSTPTGTPPPRAGFADLALGQQRELRQARRGWGCRV